MTHTETLTRTIVTALDDLKAIDIQVLDVKDITSFTDTMIIASGRSDTQVRALANGVVEAVKQQGIRPIGVEGVASEWILVDLGDAVVHVMHPTARAYYQLEKLWSGDMSLPDERRQESAHH